MQRLKVGCQEAQQLNMEKPTIYTLYAYFKMDIEKDLATYKPKFTVTPKSKLKHYWDKFKLYLFSDKKEPYTNPINRSHKFK